MATIHYFASVREKLGLATEELELPASVASVDALVDVLIKKHGSDWEKTLRTDAVLVAVNQTVAQNSTAINNSDEIAFFPPVTGG